MLPPPCCSYENLPLHHSSIPFLIFQIPLPLREVIKNYSPLLKKGGVGVQTQTMYMQLFDYLYIHNIHNILKYIENENIKPYYFSQNNKHSINNLFL